MRGPPRPLETNYTPASYAKRSDGTTENGKIIAGLGAGSSSLHLGFLHPPREGKSCFEQLCDEVTWEEMFHMGKPVPRLVSIQGSPHGQDMPCYRHPVDSHPSVQDFTPVVRYIVTHACERFGHIFNHALIQWYRGGEDNISEHADKTLDIKHGTPILNISLGCSRTLTMRTKSKLACGTGPTQIQRAALVDNSALLFDWETNRRFTHCIEPDHRADGQRRRDETLSGSQRISLTLRVVSTYRRAEDGALYGQGAKNKTLQQLETALQKICVVTQEHISAECQRLQIAFHKENKNPDFDWEEAYGEGFDILTTSDKYPMGALKPCLHDQEEMPVQALVASLEHGQSVRKAVHTLACELLVAIFAHWKDLCLDVHISSTTCDAFVQKA